MSMEKIGGKMNPQKYFNAARKMIDGKKDDPLVEEVLRELIPPEISSGATRNLKQKRNKGNIRGNPYADKRIVD